MNKEVVTQWFSWTALTALWAVLGYLGMVDGHVVAFNLFRFMTVVITGWWSFLAVISVMTTYLKLPPPKIEIHLPFWMAVIADYGVASLAAGYGHYILALMIIFQNFLELSYRNYLKGEVK